MSIFLLIEILMEAEWTHRIQKALFTIYRLLILLSYQVKNDINVMLILSKSFFSYAVLCPKILNLFTPPSGTNVSFA
jgi:hypothetical protein